jgi:hypothetical protein
MTTEQRIQVLNNKGFVLADNAYHPLFPHPAIQRTTWIKHRYEPLTHPSTHLPSIHSGCSYNIPPMYYFLLLNDIGNRLWDASTFTCYLPDENMRQNGYRDTSLPISCPAAPMPTLYLPGVRASHGDKHLIRFLMRAGPSLQSSSQWEQGMVSAILPHKPSFPKSCS